MKGILRTLLFGFFALTIGMGAAQAKGGFGKGGLRQMVEELNLTDEQKEKAKKIHQDGRDAIKAKREAMKKAHDELEAAIQGKATDDEVRAKFAALQKVQEDFAKARFEKVLALRAILTPDQRAKMKGPKGFGKRGGHHGGHDDEE